jgi:hypothetical protein
MLWCLIEKWKGEVEVSLTTSYLYVDDVASLEVHLMGQHIAELAMLSSSWQKVVVCNSNVFTIASSRPLADKKTDNWSHLF